MFAVEYFRISKTGHKLARFSFVFGVALGVQISILPFNVSAQNPVAVQEVPASSELLRVRTLVRANVLDLAERILEQQGPPLLPNGEWLNWERQLWALYRSKGSWQKLYDRIQSIPPAFPRSVHLEASNEAVTALVALGKGKRARNLLRKQLLSDSVSERDKLGLRQQVIESYLADNMLQEANTSANAFQQDYRTQDSDWLLLGARIALQSGDPNRAVNLLAPLDEPKARLLRTFARLKNESMQPDKVLEVCTRFRTQEEFEHLVKPLLAVMVEAASSAGSLVEVADLLEQYLLADASVDVSLNRALPVFTAKDLVQVYGKIARREANKAGYLGGEESTWAEFARLMTADLSAARSAVWAYIAQHADTPMDRQNAVDNYVNSLIDFDRTGLIHQLFGEGGQMGELLLTPITGLRLSTLAIEQGDVQLAADANANVSGPPPGMDYAEWLIYTGRIAIIAGRYQEGAAQLEKWIASIPRLTPEQTDKVLQAIFDLQTVDQHKLAIPLLVEVNQRSPGGKYAREIAFWIAESYSATRQHIKAADYFLFSAMQKNNGFDQWGESARYRAADALMEGNLFTDARTLFEDLLQRATEDSRKQALQQKLQQLWLKESSLKSTSESASLN
ncbi:MAG: tetratricopeptide repeat protein [bacterium]